MAKYDLGAVYNGLARLDLTGEFEGGDTLRIDYGGEESVWVYADGSIDGKLTTPIKKLLKNSESVVESESKLKKLKSFDDFDPNITARELEKDPNVELVVDDEAEEEPRPRKTSITATGCDKIVVEDAIKYLYIQQKGQQVCLDKEQAEKILPIIKKFAE